MLPTRLLFILIASLSFPMIGFNQILKPGFDPIEYRNLMLISTRTSASESYYKDYPEPIGYDMVYQSEPMGLDNLWDLWEGEKKAVISIRGTTLKAESWLANFYAAMVPAKGELQLQNNEVFQYTLASNPKAAVHIGWLISTAYLSQEIIPKIKEMYSRGIKDFLIVGHSQGGAISYLLTAYLNNLQRNSELPFDIQWKTYCSAAPKPGNLYFAYEFEAMTQGGWAFNVINAADWVPEVPVSIQTLQDFNTINPFTNAKMMIRDQKFPTNLVLKKVYRKLEKPPRRAQKNYEKYLGKMTSRIIKKTIPGFTPPNYYQSNHYVRTGTPIILQPDPDYYYQYPDDPSKLFIHHLHAPYLLLLESQYNLK